MSQDGHMSAETPAARDVMVSACPESRVLTPPISEACVQDESPLDLQT